MKYFKEIVVDTSVFINPDSLKVFGRDSQEALINFIEKAKEKDILALQVQFPF